MVYHVPESKRSLKQNRFEFTLPSTGNKVYDIPQMKFISPAFIRDYGSLPDERFMAIFIDREMPGVLDNLEDLDQLEGLFGAWQEASGITAGESEASQSSSPSTPGPSDTSSSESAANSTNSETASAGTTS